MEWARSERERLKDAWANGNFTAAFDIEMMAKNAGATGACSALQSLLSIEFDDLYGEDK
jgi:hypothetical protein